MRPGTLDRFDDISGAGALSLSPALRMERHKRTGRALLHLFTSAPRRNRQSLGVDRAEPTVLYARENVPGMCGQHIMIRLPANTRCTIAGEQTVTIIAYNMPL